MERMNLPQIKMLESRITHARKVQYFSQKNYSKNEIQYRKTVPQLIFQKRSNLLNNLGTIQ